MTVGGATALFEATGASRILVGLSGGKDSLVTLALAVEHFGAPNVEAFFMCLVDGLRCELDPVERAVRRHGVRLHVVRHWAMAELIRRQVLMPYRPGSEKLKRLRPRDIESAMRAKTGIDWIAYGHREGESIVRLAMLRKCGGIEPKFQRVYPIYKYTNHDVFAFLRAHRIQVPPALAVEKTGKSGSIRLTPYALHWLLAHHPEDFARLEKVFPFARSQVMKYERDQGATVYGRTPRAVVDPKRAVQSEDDRSGRPEEA